MKISAALFRLSFYFACFIGLYFSAFCKLLLGCRCVLIFSCQGELVTASKAIIEKEYQPKVIVSTTGPNPFNKLTDRELEEYRKEVERKQKGSEGWFVCMLFLQWTVIKTSLRVIGPWIICTGHRYIILLVCYSFSSMN